MTTDSVIGIPSKGRLREEVIDLLSEAGYRLGALRGRTAIAKLDDGLSFIEMRPRDAAVALAAHRIDAAFVATDLTLENDLQGCPTLPLGFSHSDLVVACRNESAYASIEEMSGCVVATHLPRATKQLFDDKKVSVTIMEMAGSLEGVCAAGLADAIVDLRETGVSLVQNGLRVVESTRECQAELVIKEGQTSGALMTLSARVKAVLQARQSRYVLLHLPRDRLSELQTVCPGLEKPTIIPLLGTKELVAVHLVMGAAGLWQKLDELKRLGATGIVTLAPGAIV